MQDLEKLLKDSSGIRLDIACGEVKQNPSWVGLDIRPLPSVDIVWDVNVHPWPLPDECVLMAVCSHLIEHIPPVMFRGDGSSRHPFIEFMDEVWRIMKPDGEFAIAMPYGYGKFYIQDPTHCNPCNEATWAYFDPLDSKTGGLLYKFYHVKPWKIKAVSWQPDGNMEVMLIKRREDKSYYE